MKVLYICKLYSSKGNGVIEAIKNELKYFQTRNEVALFNLGVELLDTNINTIYSYRDYDSITKLPTPFNKPDLVVFEEIYKYEYIKLYKECKKNGIPYIIIPHGSLVYKEQHRKYLKKKIANFLLFNKFIREAEAIHFLNQEEKNNSKFKYNNSIIISNGIDFNKRKYNRDNVFRYIFIGRYSIYTKGIDLMLKAFFLLKDWCIYNNTHLDLYGVGNNQEIKYMKDYVTKNKMDSYVSINGPIYGNEKKAKLEKSSVFIQTSRHEGQPMGIIEALSLGIPCITTKGTSFKDYCNDNKCGIGVDFDISELVSAIIDIHNNKNMYKKYSENAIIKFKEDFELKKVTKKTEDTYKDIIKTAKQ